MVEEEEAGDDCLLSSSSGIKSTAAITAGREMKRGDGERVGRR